MKGGAAIEENNNEENITNNNVNNFSKNNSGASSQTKLKSTSPIISVNSTSRGSSSGTTADKNNGSGSSASGNSGSGSSASGNSGSGSSASGNSGSGSSASGSNVISGPGSSVSDSTGNSGSGNNSNSGNANINAAKAAVGATAANTAANVINNVKNNNTVNGANGALKGFELVGELTFGKIITFLVVLYVILMIGYILSENYRVSSAIVQLDKYRNALFLDNMYLMKNKRRDKRLKEFYIATSFRPYLAINQLFEYTSLKILKRNVQNGVRAMFFDIYNDSLSEEAFPVVSSGFEKGNWKLTLNTLTFESVIRELSKTIFTSGYTNNYNDPFFLLLNLKTNRNFKSVNRIQETIYKYFKDQLLPSKYSYQSSILADAPIRDLMGKVVIITSQGYENTNLEELVNGSWNTDNLKKISYRSLDSATPKSDAIKMNIDDVRTFNDSGLSIVVPPEESFFTYNYLPEPFFTAGCQFICMNYQLNNQFMEPYITKFNTSSFVEKKIM